MSFLLLLWPLWLTRRPEHESPIWKRRSLIVLISFLTLRYLFWRITETLNLDSPLSSVLSVLMLSAECCLLLTGLVMHWLAWRRYPDRSKQIDTLRREWQTSDWRPQVDILIPTYGEPLEVLERTVRGCLDQTYPHRTVWLLDDSHRQEVLDLTRRLGCRYRNRPERANAKAGNLNDGLRQSQAELVAVFDADFIPQRRFLESCIGFLQDPDVALVQTPQSFLNADPVVRNLGMERWLLPDEESFYRWIEPVRDSWGAVVCAGTSFLVRRKALEQVGGFVEEALSEDFVTGIALHEQGWEMVYLQEKLSAGLAAESMADFVHQRQRWAAGTLQSLVLRQGPVRARGLSIGQRLSHMEGVIHWINNLPRLILMLMPLSYGLLGIAPIRFTDDAITSNLLPLWATLLLSVGWLNRNSRAALLSELTSWVLTVPLTLTLLRRTLGSRIGFKVTPKHQRRDRGGWDWPIVTPLLLLFGLNAANLFGLLRSSGTDYIPGQFVGMGWAVLNLLGIMVSLRACWDPATTDLEPWFQVQVGGELVDAGGHRHSCSLTAISETGAELLFSDQVPPFVDSSRLQWDPTIPSLPVIVTAATGSRRAVHWGPLDDRQRLALLRWLYGRAGCWRDRKAPPEWRGFLILLKRVLLGPPAPGPFQRSLVPLATHGIRAGQH